MGANHSTICFKGNGLTKFVQGGLESYTGFVPSDLRCAEMGDTDEKDFPGNIEEFSCLRNHNVYAWLGGYDNGGVYQNGGREHYRAVTRKTTEFLEWIDKHDKTSSAIVEIDPLDEDDRQHRKTRNFTEGRLIDDSYYSRLLLPMDFLLNFDYDQVALVGDIDKWCNKEMNSYYATCKPHPEGKTWRELFTIDRSGCVDNDYFIFLEKARAAGWEAALITFG